MGTKKFLKGKSFKFIYELMKLCRRLEIPDCKMLLAVMEFESGLNPAAINSSTNATGLIQFMPRTAQYLGTTVEELRAMSATEQLPFVELYLEPYRGRMSSVADVYMAVFWPAAIGKPHSTVLFRKGTPAYQFNSALDWDGKGWVTKGDAVKRVEAIYAEMTTND